MNLETWQAGKKDVLVLLEPYAQVTWFSGRWSWCDPVIVESLLHPFLVFINLWQLSHNFTPRLVENLSVEFMGFFFLDSF